MEEAVLDDAADWLERILQQELKQEVDREDMVVRTLPVFIAAIGVMLAFVGLVLQKLPKLSGDPLIFVTYCGLFSLVLLIAAVIGILIYALRDRTVFRPLGGRRLADYVDSLRDFHADAGTAAEVETRVLADVRATQCDQLAYSIAANREINDRRRQARGAAFTILLAVDPCVGDAVGSSYRHCHWAGRPSCRRRPIHWSHATRRFPSGSRKCRRCGRSVRGRSPTVRSTMSTNCVG